MIKNFVKKVIFIMGNKTHFYSLFSEIDKLRENINTLIVQYLQMVVIEEKEMGLAANSNKTPDFHLLNQIKENKKKLNDSLIAFHKLFKEKVKEYKETQWHQDSFDIREKNREAEIIILELFKHASNKTGIKLEQQ